MAGTPLLLHDPAHNHRSCGPMLQRVLGNIGNPRAAPTMQPPTHQIAGAPASCHATEQFNACRALRPSFGIAWTWPSCPSAGGYRVCSAGVLIRGASAVQARRAEQSQYCPPTPPHPSPAAGASAPPRPGTWCSSGPAACSATQVRALFSHGHVAPKQLPQASSPALHGSPWQALQPYSAA